MRYRRSKVQWWFMPDANRVTVTTECILPLLHTLKVTFGYTHASLITYTLILRVYWATSKTKVSHCVFQVCADESHVVYEGLLALHNFVFLNGMFNRFLDGYKGAQLFTSTGSTIYIYIRNLMMIYVDLPARMSVASQRTHTCS
jgi:hypothetical protein